MSRLDGQVAVVHQPAPVFLPVIASLYIAHWESSPARVIVGSLLICGFPGIWYNNIRRPVLVDPTALTWALGSAVLSLAGWWFAALIVALIAACMKETAPVFAAAFCLNPLLLIGVAAPVVRRATAKAGPDTHNSKALADPLGSARKAHAEHVFDPRVMLLPWGAGMLAVFVTDPVIALLLVLSLLLGYGQLVVAVNTARLYQWAAPAVALAAASVIPPGWAAAVLTAHLFNPLAGNGR
ncbi:hypothetical protein [Nocardia amikacinitolerans]|uniref:hypothetical protein n=1 Tax=Nocardia amikacinitolerans TaxID=756689 RepID=UPI0015CB1638|nr:hypothetical protein [Nocardia amikacinitolerans]